MRKIAQWLLTAVWLSFLAASHAHAQWMVPVVSSCGTPPQTYNPGAPYPLTQDTTGVLCTNAGGGATNATIVAPLGHATADTAAVSVVPSATATFPFSGSAGVASFITGSPSGTVPAVNAGLFYSASGTPTVLGGGIYGPYFDISASSLLATDINNPPNLNLNGVNTAVTGVTPAVARTITVVPLDVTIAGIGGVASGTPAAVGATLPITNTPTATSGALNYGPHYSVATSGGDTQFVKASPGTVYTITVTQSTTTAMELKLYNSTSAPICSSATGIVDNIPIPSNVTSPGYHLTFPVGRAFSTGIAYCIVAFGAPAASTDSGTPAVGVTLSMTYE